MIVTSKILVCVDGYCESESQKEIFMENTCIAVYGCDMVSNNNSLFANNLIPNRSLCLRG